MHPQPQPFILQLFLDFRANFSPGWPLNFFCHHESSCWCIKMYISAISAVSTCIYQHVYIMYISTCIYFFVITIHQVIWSPRALLTTYICGHADCARNICMLTVILVWRPTNTYQQMHTWNSDALHMQPRRLRANHIINSVALHIYIWRSDALHMQPHGSRADHITNSDALYIYIWGSDALHIYIWRSDALQVQPHGLRADHITNSDALHMYTHTYTHKILSLYTCSHADRARSTLYAFWYPTNTHMYLYIHVQFCRPPHTANPSPSTYRSHTNQRSAALHIHICRPPHADRTRIRWFLVFPT